MNDAITPEKTILDLVSLNQWLDNQLLEYQAAINAEKDDIPVTNEDPEAHLNRLSTLKQGLLKASQDHSLQQLMLQRVSMTQTLTSALFPEETENNHEEGLDKSQTRGQIQQLAEEQRKLVTQVMKVHQEMEEIKPELEEIKKQNRECIQGILEVREDLRREKKQQSQPLPDSLHQAQELLSTTEAQWERLRNVFQGVIMGSGINWGEEADMMKLVMMLGQPTEDIEKHNT